MFAAIARRYDLANHLLSGGMDYFWRARTARLVQRWKPQRILDLATGSGDLMRDLRRACPDAFIVGADFCAPMLQQARAKGLTNLVVADALALPFADESFDVVTIAFGFRNMNPWLGALQEIRSKLTAGGKLLILDFSMPGGILKRPYRWYLHRILPKIADLCTGSRGAYEYLGDSIEKFPRNAEMRDLLQRGGLEAMESIALTCGVVTLYTAQRRA